MFKRRGLFLVSISLVMGAVAGESLLAVEEVVQRRDLRPDRRAAELHHAGLRAVAEPFEDVERRSGFEVRVLELRDDQRRPRQIDRLGRNLGLELRDEKERRTHRAHCDPSRSPALMATVMRFSRGGTGQTYDAS